MTNFEAWFIKIGFMLLFLGYITYNEWHKYTLYKELRKRDVNLFTILDKQNTELVAVVMDFAVRLRKYVDILLGLVKLAEKNKGKIKIKIDKGDKPSI